MAPETQYVKTADGAHVAYQVFGEGAFDLVYLPGFASNLDRVLATVLFTDIVGSAESGAAVGDAVRPARETLGA